MLSSDNKSTQCPLNGAKLEQPYFYIFDLSQNYLIVFNKEKAGLPTEIYIDVVQARNDLRALQNGVLKNGQTP